MAEDYTSLSPDRKYFAQRLGHVLKILDDAQIPRPGLVYTKTRNANRHGRYFISQKTVEIFVGPNRSIHHTAEVVAHEIGHHVDAHYGWKSEQYWKRICIRCGLDPSHSGWRKPIEDFADTFMLATRASFIDPTGDMMPMEMLIGGRRRAAMEVFLADGEGKNAWQYTWQRAIDAASPYKFGL
jgi:hypothetical protein